MGRISRTGLFLACLAAPLPALAGFEFTPAAPAAQAQGGDMSDAALAGSGGDDMMPSVPTAEVTAVPLTPGPNEAIDTQGLLTATSRGMSVTMPPQAPTPGPAPVAASASGGGLYIDPYPLKGQNGAPSQADLMNAMAGMPDAPQRSAMPASSANGMMPIPGGEGPPIYPAGRVSSYMPTESQRAAPAPQCVEYPAVAARRTVAAQPQPATATQPNASYSEAVGFGRDLPLALAMSQIVPPDYSYSFGRNVNKGATVSWQGGKPWNQVLDEMLAPSGMKAVINGGDVKIVKA